MASGQFGLRLKKAFLAFAAAVSATAPIANANAQGISLLRDAETEKFLDDHARPIFKAAGINPNSIEILLVNDQTFNAFAGARYMGVNTGMLTFAETPSEVDAVIAHEAGHLAANHTTRSAEAMANASRPMILGLLLGAAAIAAGSPEAGIGILGLGQNVAIADYLVYSRSQEGTADQLSITYLDRLGKSTKGAMDLWSRMRNYQIITGRRANPFLQTHPLANDRYAALAKRAQASPYFEKKDSPEEIARLKLIQAKIKGFLEDPNQVLRDYPLSDQSEPAHYARAVAYYRYSDIDKALKEVRALTGERPDYPYFHELEGQILFEYGHADEAVAPSRKAVKLLPANALMRIQLGRTLLASNEPDLVEEAAVELKRATTLEPDNGFAWFELARAYSQMGDEPKAQLATAEARYYSGAKPDANQFARRALRGLERGTPEWRRAMDIILATQPAEGAPPLPQAEPEESGEPKPVPQEEPKTPDVPDPIIIEDHNTN
ncbi:M48 family metalloprotease [Hyphococcus luteus]|uniref:Peptidase M48 n=1 Tax=Hyphococcus luteus TaxID=2058213 RepID=A0A2S7JZB2_9PROT|nr:M48 family metalloprotease [Marinicaulis flavus]PQA85538.1 peptidase M48 [Marinicaulis flavus]